MLSFFPRSVLDEILNLIGSVSEDFPSYSYLKDILNRDKPFGKKKQSLNRFGSSEVKKAILSSQARQRVHSL